MNPGYYRVGDCYVDTSTPTAPVLWYCTTAGNASSSVWAKMSGGGGGTAEVYNNAHAYAVGSIVLVPTNQTIASIGVQAGWYVCFVAVTIGTGNQVPQFPVPTTGTVYWQFICPTMGLVGGCAGGSSASVYVPTTGAF
jgi:hypothetical protein